MKQAKLGACRERAFLHDLSEQLENIGKIALDFKLYMDRGNDQIQITAGRARQPILENLHPFLTLVPLVNDKLRLAAGGSVHIPRDHLKGLFDVVSRAQGDFKVANQQRNLLRRMLRLS